MIIVSQDKKMIIENFNLRINEPGEYNKNYVIYNVELGEDLGEYATEERAKEVLKEILEAYKNCNYYSLSQMGKGFVINDYYEMPKE